MHTTQDVNVRLKTPATWSTRAVLDRVQDASFYKLGIWRCSASDPAGKISASGLYEKGWRKGCGMDRLRQTEKRNRNSLLYIPISQNRSRKRENKNKKIIKYQGWFRDRLEWNYLSRFFFFSRAEVANQWQAWNLFFGHLRIQKNFTFQKTQKNAERNTRGNCFFEFNLASFGRNRQ